MNSQLEPAVAEYLDTLTQQLTGLPLQKQQDVRAEVLQHIEAIADAALLLGDAPTEALRVALRQFGDPQKIGRQIAREWRIRAWRRRGVILLQALAAPVSYVGLAALGTTVMAVISLMTDGPEEDYALWLQRTYWLIGLEAVVKLGQAAFAMTGEANFVTASYDSGPSVGLKPTHWRVSLNFAAFLAWFKTAHLKPPRLPISYLSAAALTTLLLAILSSVRDFPDEDYAYWLYRTGWLIGLDTLIKLFQEGIEPFVAKRKAKSKIFIELIQPNGFNFFYSPGELAHPGAAFNNSALPDRRNIPLNMVCFLFPPLGLASWLILDNRTPRKARGAGRSAMRGTVVALILFCFLDIGLAVHHAIFAIGNAHLQPINPNRPSHSLRHRVHYPTRR